MMAELWRETTEEFGWSSIGTDLNKMRDLHGRRRAGDECCLNNHRVEEFGPSIAIMVKSFEVTVPESCAC